MMTASSVAIVRTYPDSPRMRRVSGVAPFRRIPRLRQLLKRRALFLPRQTKQCLNPYALNMARAALLRSLTAGFARMLKRLPTLGQITRQLALLVGRGSGTAIKFLLSVYMVRYLGLHELGFYGLLVGATTAMPAILGFGLTPWFMRQLVHLPPAQAIPAIFARLCLSLAIQLVMLPLALFVDVLTGEPVPLRWTPAIAAILLLEGLGSEVCNMLTARRHVRLSETLLFIRTGLWPLPVMAYGMTEP